MFKKRGIAPLVATLLLVSFAIALGVTIMNFGRAQVELEATCPIDIGLEFSGDPICFDGKTIHFNIENGVNIKIEGIFVNVIGSKKAETFDLSDAKIARAGNYQGHIPFSADTGGDIRQVKISPKVTFYDKEQICNKKGLVVETIKSC